MDQIDIFPRLGVALAVGLLIGMERGWQERDIPDGGRVAGLRTFGLVGLSGGLCALLAQVLGPVILGFGFVAVAGVLAAAHWQTARLEHALGITTTVAGLVTFALGALAVSGNVEAAAGVATVTALLLGLKPQLHRWLRAMEQREMFAALQLALISLVVLPVLPNRGFGPYGAVNPYHLWWMVVLIAGLSFAGYLAVRVLGAGRGIVLTALFGGLVSSTAVTLSFSRVGQDREALLPALAAGVVVASTIMFPRMALLVSVTYPPLLHHLALPLGAMALTGMLAGVLLLRRRAPGGAPNQQFSNPFDMKTAVSLGVLLAVILVLAAAVRDWFGDAGLYVLGVVSGLADVDALTLSASRLAGEGVAPQVAATAIMLAAAANTVVKSGLVLAIGGWGMARPVFLAFGAMLAVGLGTVMWGPLP